MYLQALFPQTQMNSAKKVFCVSFLALLLLCAAFLSPVVMATQTVIPITGSFTLADEVVNGNVYNVGSMTTSSSASLNYVTECTIEGDGIGFTGFTSSVTTSTLRVFNLTMAQTTVTNATIQITGYFPPSSTLLISYTTATMQGTTPLFDIRNLALENHVVVYFLDTTVTWNEGGGGGDVILVGGATRQLFQTYSGFFMVNTHATYAAHIMHQVLPQCPSTAHCLDVYNGLLAIDVATCVNCTGAFLMSEHTKSFLTGANSGVVRISNCTSTGGQPFVQAAAPVSFQFSAIGNLVLYGITTDGVFFAKGTPIPQLYDLGYMSFMHINALSTGNATVLPELYGSNTAWAGNITFNGTYMSTVALLVANGVKPNYLLDPYSTVIDKTSLASYYTEINGTAASVFCTRTGFSSSSYEQLDGWKRGHCNCASTTYGPYCTQSMDPISYYVNYNAAGTEDVCNVANCTTCMAMTSEQCTACDAGFKLNGTTCTAKVCNAANCSSCVFDSETACASCLPGYKLGTDNVTCTPKVCQAANCVECVYDSETECSVCESNYKRDSDNTTCVDMPCNVANCSVCVTEEDTTCETCSPNFNLITDDGTSCTEKVCQVTNCNTCVFDTEDQCAVCDGNFKRSADNASCVAMTCLAEHCDVCVTEENTTCQTCSINYKLDTDSTSCTEMVCQAANCSTCVYGTESECEVCDGNYKRGTDNVSCVAMTCTVSNCDVCVTEENATCETCSPNYKLDADDGSCTEKVCQVANCSQCVYDTEDTCETCDGNYKRDADNVTCVPMTCLATNCDVCVTEENTTCQSCSPNYKLNADGTSCTEKVCEVANCSKCVYDTEDTCETCDGNYKRDADNATCVAMTCTVSNCDVCTTEEDTTCEICSPNYNLNADDGICTEKVCQVANCSKCVFDTEDQCGTCMTNHKAANNGTSCEPMVCQVANCSKCVDDTEDQCATCSAGFSAQNAACAAVSSSSGLSKNALIGIIVGIVALAVLAALLIVLLLCCCRRKVSTVHAFEHVAAELRDMTPTEAEQKAEGDAKEKTYSDTDVVSQFQDEDSVRNPLLPVPQTPTEQPQEAPKRARSSRRSSRRTRSMHLGQMQFTDVDLDQMYAEDNEYIE